MFQLPIPCVFVLITFFTLLSNKIYASPIVTSAPTSSDHKVMMYLSEDGTIEELLFNRAVPYTQLDQHPKLPKDLLISLDLKEADIGDFFMVLQGKTTLAKQRVEVLYEELLTPRYVLLHIKKVSWCEDIRVIQLRTKKLISQKILRFTCTE